MRRLVPVLITFWVAGCAAGPDPAAPGPDPSVATADSPAVAGAVSERPTPYPVVPPPEFQRATEQRTRTRTGEPGPRYWQQWVEYSIQVRVDVDAKTLTGNEAIRYHNRSPHRLPVLVVNLLQNYHAEGAERVRPAPVTGGVDIGSVSVNGQELGVTTSQRMPGWLVEGTLMLIIPPDPVEPRDSIDLAIEWSFPLPQSGASGRMGYSDEELLHLAYWYPQLATLDDVVGWHAEPFRGNAEFYSNFGRYELSIDAPEGWLVMSTGELENAGEVLAPDVVERLRQAESSDDVVHVVTHEGSGAATASHPTGRLVWEFTADSVRDVSFSVMRNYAWDAARTPVGDRDGDGQTEYARVDAFWRDYADFYDEAWRYTQHSVDFLSRYTGVPYPWPHMSVVEGGGIIGGGMEYPMMTLIGDYNAAGADALYNVVAHEVAHMWVPMLLSTNERRYAWFDEGTTTFNENQSRAEFFEGQDDPWPAEHADYLNLARAGVEGPIMRWSDHHRSEQAYQVASYRKPAAALRALRGVLGEERFEEAHRAFYDRWAFRHPYPWDLFNTFEDVTGEDLDWFWRSWYYESTMDGDWFLSQAVADVERLASGETRITVRDLGWVPMPVPLRITRSDGEVLERTIPVDRWLTGTDETSITIPAGAPVAEVVIDPERYFPDMNRRDNVWSRSP